MIGLHTRLVPNGAVLGARVGDEAVMMHIELGRYFTLDPIGREIWQSLAEGRTLGEVCRHLAEHYDAPQAEIEADVVDLARRLVERGLATEA